MTGNRCSRIYGALILGVVALFCGSATVLADPVVVPGSTANNEGLGNNGNPFDLPGLFPQQYQQVYGATEFGTVPIQISGVAFRPDAESGRSFSATLPSVSIFLSTTSAAPDGLSEFLNDNIGTDNTLVRSGPLALSSQNTGPVGGPKDFDIKIAFDNSFFYDPTQGNLLMFVVTAGGAETTPFDANFATDSVSRAWTSGGAPTARDTLGLVTQFDVSPVPEPTSLILVGTALSGLAIGRLRRRKCHARPQSDGSPDLEI